MVGKSVGGRLRTDDVFSKKYPKHYQDLIKIEALLSSNMNEGEDVGVRIHREHMRVGRGAAIDAVNPQEGGVRMRPRRLCSSEGCTNHAHREDCAGGIIVQEPEYAVVKYAPIMLGEEDCA